jgi:hypothetical protein
MRTFEEIRELLAEKIRYEKKRLRTFDSKANAFDISNAITRFVLALMAESRYKELRRLVKHKHRGGNGKYKTDDYLKERLKATSDMSKVLKKYAEAAEKARPHLSEAEQKRRRHELKEIEEKAKKLKKHNHRSKHDK